jgi:SH3-like domain-containing protein
LTEDYQGKIEAEKSKLDQLKAELNDLMFSASGNVGRRQVIEDYEKQTGWVSQSLLTKKRTLMVYTSKDFVKMHIKNSEKSRVIFHLENQVIGDYLKCSQEWCGLKINGKKGWVQKVDLFGADEEATEEKSN